MGCKKSHSRDPKSMLGSGVTPQKKALLLLLSHIFVKDYLIFQIFFLVVGSCVHPINLKKYHWSLHYKKTTPIRPRRPWIPIYIAGFSWPNCGPLFKMRSLEARFGEKLAEVVWLFKAKECCFCYRFSLSRIFCAVGLDLEFCPCLIRGIAKYVPS